jgi:uncharacterized protein (TIGR00106 family)
LKSKLNYPEHFILKMTLENHKVVAEISITPLGKRYSNGELPTSIRNELAISIDAIKKIKGIKVMVTGMSTQMEADSIQDILKAIEYAHQSLKDKGIPRIISSIRIDERFDKSETLEERVNSVQEKLDR